MRNFARPHAASCRVPWSAGRRAEVAQTPAGCCTEGIQFIHDKMIDQNGLPQYRDRIIRYQSLATQCDTHEVERQLATATLSTAGLLGDVDAPLARVPRGPALRRALQQLPRDVLEQLLDPCKASSLWHRQHSTHPHSSLLTSHALLP